MANWFRTVLKGKLVDSIGKVSSSHIFSQDEYYQDLYDRLQYGDEVSEELFKSIHDPVAAKPSASVEKNIRTWVIQMANPGQG